MTEDWKAALAALRGDAGQEPESVAPADSDAAGTADKATDCVAAS